MRVHSGLQSNKRLPHISIRGAGLNVRFGLVFTRFENPDRVRLPILLDVSNHPDHRQNHNHDHNDRHDSPLAETAFGLRTPSDCSLGGTLHNGPSAQNMRNLMTKVTGTALWKNWLQIDD
jgi:hypothetical protein